MTESVNHPQHYGGDTPYEVIKVAEAWGFDGDAYLFNVLKYIRRDKNDELEDLKKARFYLDRKIKRMEQTAAEHVAALTNTQDRADRTGLEVAYGLKTFPQLKFKIKQQGLNAYPPWFDAQLIVDTDWPVYKLCDIAATTFNLKTVNGGYGISIGPVGGFLQEDQPVSWMLKMWPRETHHYYLRARDV